ncbi:hypothetical protein LUR56_39805 [Streptomyces sp. MT29]|nr:hypothetical protein [Streptomyces sp. MT29]
MYSSRQPHPARELWLYLLLGVLLLFVPLLVVAVCLKEGEPDSVTKLRDCPARHTASGSYVPAGARPCVLRTGGHPAGAAASTNDSGSHGRDRKQPGRPAPAVKPPVAKVPAAPAVKVPPPVRLSK